jgi:3-phytase
MATRLFRLFAAAAASLVAASCASLDAESISDSGTMLTGVGSPVPAAGETVAVGTANRDAADDPEIWVDPADPSRALILGTDKQAGLYAYDLSGKVVQFIPDGLLNNVDLRGGFRTPDGERVLVAASDRGRKGAAFYLLDPATLRLTPWGVVPLDLTESYGLCMGRHGDAFVVVVNSTDGQVRQLAVSVGPDGKLNPVEQRRFALATQTEGCVIDDAKGLLYIGEENRGLWRFPLTGEAQGTLIAAAPSEALKADVEGISLLREGAKTWLIVSSQGDSAFAVWRVDGAEPAYAGRFSVMGGAGADPVTGADGVAAIAGPVGAFPEGLVVMQDDADTAGEAPGEAPRQNFKLVDWREVKRALGLQ